MLDNFTDKIKSLATRAFMEENSSQLLKSGALPPSIRKQKEMLEQYHFSDLLPYEFYDDENKLFFTDESYGFGFQVLPTVGMDEAAVNNLSNMFTHGMEKGYVVQICLISNPNILPILTRWADARIYDEQDQNGRKKGIFRTLARKRVEYLKKGAWKSLFDSQIMLVRDYQIILTVMFPRKNHIELSEKEKSKLSKVKNSVHGGLLSAGIAHTELSEAWFVDFMHGLLNPVDDRRTEITPDSFEKMSEQVIDASTSYYVDRDSLCISTHDVDTPAKLTEVRSYKVKSFPKTWAAWNNSMLLGHPIDNNRRIPAPYMITLTITYPDQLNQMTKAKTKYIRSGQMADSLGKIAPTWHQRRADWGFVVDKLEQGHTMALMNYQVTLFCDPETADYSEHQLVSVYRSSGFRLVRERFVALHAFLNALPMCATPSLINDAINLKRFKTMLTWSAANLAPLTAEWKGTGSPFLLLLGRRGQIMQVDPLDNQQGNYNIAIAAASGSGKSFIGQEMVKNTLELGGRVWLFDRGRSFQNQNKMLGGEYISCTPGSGISFNPFSGVRSWDGSETEGSEKIMIRDLIIQMVTTRDNKAIKAYHIGWIEQALQKVWETECNGLINL